MYAYAEEGVRLDGKSLCIDLKLEDTSQSSRRNITHQQGAPQ